MPDTASPITIRTGPAKLSPSSALSSGALNEPNTQPTVGLALGSGASRGWSHIGVVRGLLNAGIEPSIICGTSVGAMVGASYLTGKLDALADWVLGSTRTDVLRFFGPQFTQSGFVDLKRFRSFLHNYVAGEGQLIEGLPKPYAAVSTDLNTGRETWFTKGHMAEAVQASMSMPGLFPAVRIEDRWMVDGGLVNPVPVSVCHALGADVVIAVNLNFGIVGKNAADTSKPPGLFYSITNSIGIFEDRITRSRLAGDPADVILSPDVSQIGMLEFHLAGKAIEEGERCVSDALSEILRATSRS